MTLTTKYLDLLDKIWKYEERLEQMEKENNLFECEHLTNELDNLYSEKDELLILMGE